MKNEIPLSCLVENPDNISEISDEDFALLVEKIRRNPDGLAANRIAYVTDYVTKDGVSMAGMFVALSGNKRLRALKKIRGEDGAIPAEWTEDVTSMTTEQRRIFTVSMNVVEGEFEKTLLRELYTPEELKPLIGEDALDDLMATVEQSPSDNSAHDDETVTLAITLPAEDYRRAYIALISHNEDIGRALMEVVDAE